MGQGSTQTVVSGRETLLSSIISTLFTLVFKCIQFVTLCDEFVFPKALGAQCCSSMSRGGQQSSFDELMAYRVIGVIDKVNLTF